jgi:NAD+ diphosphatase
MNLVTFFSGGSIDRNSAIRSSDALLQAASNDSATRFVVMWRSQAMIAEGAAVTLSRAELGSGWLASNSDEQQLIYLGKRDDIHLFALALPDDLAADGPTEAAFENHRSMLTQTGPEDAALLAYAKGMLEWQKRHQYCGHCGANNTLKEGGFVMLCTNSDCGQRCFPRVDPAIIVLATLGDRCLLGRQVSWPKGRFSTIAGFAEPGESLEDAVRRELKEETNIETGSVTYLGSQPWPFPSAMMIGFHATAISSDIHRNDGELIEAGWFSREDIAGGEIFLPPESSIAYRLIEAWFDRWDGARLASLGISSDFSRSAGSGT